MLIFHAFSCSPKPADILRTSIVDIVQMYRSSHAKTHAGQRNGQVGHLQESLRVGLERLVSPDDQRREQTAHGVQHRISDPNSESRRLTRHGFQGPKLIGIWRRTNWRQSVQQRTGVVID